MMSNNLKKSYLKERLTEELENQTCVDSFMLRMQNVLKGSIRMVSFIFIDNVDKSS